MTGFTSYTTEAAGKELKFAFAAVLYVFIVVSFAYCFFRLLIRISKAIKKTTLMYHIHSFLLTILACSIEKLDWI